MESCYDYNSKLKNGTKNKNWNWTKLNIWKIAPKLENWKKRLDKIEKLDKMKNWIKLKKWKIGQNWRVHNDPEYLCSQSHDFRPEWPGLQQKVVHFLNPDKILQKMKWVWPCAVDFLTRFWAIICPRIKNIPFLTELFFKIKIETSPGWRVQK